MRLLKHRHTTRIMGKEVKVTTWQLAEEVTFTAEIDGRRVAVWPYFVLSQAVGYPR